MLPEIKQTFEQLKNVQESIESLDALIDLTSAAYGLDHESGAEVGRYTRGRIERILAPDVADDVTRVRKAWDVMDLCRDHNLATEETGLYLRILLLMAQNRDFDSYLLYLEKNRLQRERFYLPKRKQFIKHGIIPALQDMLDDKLDILTISAVPGSQKAQPLYSKVLTPDGFIRMGDVKVGTKVISGTGNVCDVIGVYPQGVKPIYELTFDDGSKCRCSDEHLWKVQTRSDRVHKNKDGSEKYRIVELKSMLDNVRVESDRRLNYSIDYVKPIEYERKQFYIHPYVMGALLGDGGLSGGNIRFSNPDTEVLYLVNALLPEGYHLKHVCAYDYNVVGDGSFGRWNRSKLRLKLEEYGLYGKRSHEKHIPKEYLCASVEQRLWLLRGLMDTDGSPRGSMCEYSTSSLQLAEDIAELVHSLGGYCSIVRRKSGYKKNGVFKRCKDSYDITIQFTANSEKVFCLNRKNKAYQPKRKVIKRFIKDIQFVGNEECQCIYIDDPSHLYITDNYIITHNTTCEKFFNSAIIGWFPDDFNLFFSHSADICRMYYDGVLDICVNTQEYTWQEIFPGLSVNRTNAKAGSFNVGKFRGFSSLQTTSVGSENAGKVRVSPNGYLLVDDMIGKLEEALNKSILDKLWNVYSVDARQRKLDGAKEIHIATRWSVHDVIGRLQRLYDGNKDVRTRFIAIPDIDEETGKSNFDYEYMGFTEDFFKDQELAMDDITYRCLYKNQPIEREGLLYHDEDLRRYLSLPDKQPDAILSICDVKGKGADFMFLPVLYQYGDDYYLDDCVCDDNADYELQYEKLTDVLVRNAVQACEFESNAGGDRVAVEVEKRVRERGGSCTITTRPTETNKETRIIVNSEWVKRRVLFRDKSLYSPKEDYGVMMNWLLCYSTVGKNEHDDVPDGLSMFRIYVDGMRPKLATVTAVYNPLRSKGVYAL